MEKSGPILGVTADTGNVSKRMQTGLCNRADSRDKSGPREQFAIPMDKNPVAKLSDGQRKCLRMVYRHMETKEIARVLGISPDGVNQRIKTAMRILGVNRRRDAAMILAQAEGTESYPPLVHPPRDIAIAPDPAMLAPSSEGGRHSGSSAGVMREEQAVFWSAPSSRRPALPFPSEGARPSDLGVLKKLALMAGIAIGIALSFGALIAGVEGLTRLVRG